MSKNKKGVERKEYPKLVRNKDGKKVRVLNKEEEAQYTNIEKVKEENKTKGWN